MKAFHLNELAGFLGLFQKHTGAQVQEVTSSDSQVMLRMRHRQNFYLFFDLSATAPVLFWLSEEVKLKKKTIPLALFLKKYFTDAILKDVRLINGEGRILHFHFHSNEFGPLELEARLYPHGQNLIAKTAEKSIAFNKPKDINKEEIEISPVANIDEIMAIKWQEYQDSKKPKGSKVDPKLKTTELIARLESDLEKYPHYPYKEMAEKIKAQQNYEGVDPKMIDTDLPWFEAVKILIDKDKKQIHKKQALKDRIAILSKDLKDGKIIDAKAKDDMFSGGSAKGRVKVLPDGRRAYVGKSAKDNMALLRSAKAWYLWMHVRDYPSGHLILQQNKGQIVTETDLKDLALFLVKESGFAKSLRDGDMFDVQYTECRYIKPIKGDKLGRVHVQKEKVLRIRFSD
jgi:predicted ribosome quality control (RQC) complex YloA/Tae2 family protein